ncbi:MAG: acyltransferase family protein [Rhodoglobus sp.]
MHTLVGRSDRFFRSEVGTRDWVNFVKGAAIICVVLFHVWLFYTDIQLTSVPRIKTILELFPIPAFFLIAGMFGGRQASWSLPELWRRRLLPYLYLYVLWSVIRFGMAWVFPVVRGDDGISGRDPLNLLQLFVWPSSSYWFIYALALATLLAWLARRLNQYLHLGLAAVISALFMSGILNLHNTGWNGLAEKYFFFVAGVVLSRQIYAAATKVRSWHVLTLVVLMLILAVPLMFFRNWIVQLLAFVATVAMLACVIAASVFLARLRSLQFVSYLGAQSFPIYILHLFVVTAATVLARWITQLPLFESYDFPPPRMVGAIIVVLVTVVTVVASVYLSRWATKLPWLFIPPFAALKRRRLRQAPDSQAVGSR